MRGLWLIPALLAASTASPAQAADLGKHGNVFEIAETPIYEMIRKRLERLDNEGKLDELNETFQKNSIKTISRPKAVEGFLEAKEPGSYMFDPSITITKDIRDDKGTLIAQAGTVINPMHHTNMPYALLFIDGDKEAHVDWAISEHDRLDKKVKIILVRGAPLKLMKERKVQMYFDQGGNMFRRFELDRVPARIEQDGTLLRVTEVPVHEG